MSFSIRAFAPLLVLALPAMALIAALRRPALSPASHPAQNMRRETSSNLSRGAAVFAGIVMPDLLLVTENPALLLNTFSFKPGPPAPTLLDRIYPDLRKVPVDPYGRAASVEALLQLQPSVVLTWSSAAPALLAVGLPAVSVAIATEEDAMERIRLYARLAGELGRAEELIDAYRRGFAGLQAELKPEQIARKPRILMLNLNGGILSSNNGHALVWRRAGLVEAQRRSLGAIDEESVLAIDPDILLLTGDLSLRAVQAMPGLRHLRAVREGRAYRLPHGLAAFPWNIIDLPYYARWLAELVYPDRLAPALRPMLREAYLRELGYRCSSEELDRALDMEQNRDTAGYERFQEP